MNTGRMSPMVVQDGYAWFLLDVYQKDEYQISFKVYEVTAWDSDTDPVPVEKELYLSGVIKWDGCSHLNFGEKDNPGYLHLCGKHSWEKHVQLMNELYETALVDIKRLEI